MPGPPSFASTVRCPAKRRGGRGVVQVRHDRPVAGEGDYTLVLILLLLFR
ncbi:MAG TPA: hypothetical protein VK358_03580 [Longimicrobium sp.]|nr:hypothetical protein [Longimicrobium sp.]